MATRAFEAPFTWYFSWLLRTVGIGRTRLLCLISLGLPLHENIHVFIRRRSFTLFDLEFLHFKLFRSLSLPFGRRRFSHGLSKFLGVEVEPQDDPRKPSGGGLDGIRNLHGFR